MPPILHSSPPPSLLGRYGHRYPGAAMTDVQMPAMKTSVPFSRVSVELVPKRIMPRSNDYADEMAVSMPCCDYSPTGSSLIVRAGDGLKVVVASLDVGPASNAAEFV